MLNWAEANTSKVMWVFGGLLFVTCVVLWRSCWNHPTTPKPHIPLYVRAAVTISVWANHEVAREDDERAKLLRRLGQLANALAAHGRRYVAVADPTN